MRRESIEITYTHTYVYLIKDWKVESRKSLAKNGETENMRRKSDKEDPWAKINY